MNTMSATTSVKTSRSMRAIISTWPMAACASALFAPFEAISAFSVRFLRLR